MRLTDHDGRQVEVLTGIVRHDTGAAIPAIRFGETEAVLDLPTASGLIANIRQAMYDLAAIEKQGTSDDG